VAILSSPRRRRRLLYVGAFLCAVVPLIFLGVHFSDPGDPQNANGPSVSLPGYEQPKPARFTKAKQAAVHEVLRKFIGTAVVRRDVGSSWELSAPSLREGFTRKQWSRGDLPVPPYPAAKKGWGDWSYVEYSYKGTVGLEVFLFPKPGSGWSAMSADVELVRGHDGNWLVDYWMPKRFHGPPAVAAKSKAKADRSAKRVKARPKRNAASAQAAPVTSAEPPKPSRLWWAVPLGLLALIVLAPIGIIAGSWARHRRAERQFRAS